MGVNGLNSGDFSSLMISSAGDSASAQIGKLQSAITGGKLSESQKMEAMGKLEKLHAQQAQHQQQKANPLAGKSIFDVAKQHQQKGID
jgi:hypothetical protein